MSRRFCRKCGAEIYLEEGHLYFFNVCEDCWEKTKKMILKVKKKGYQPKVW